MVCLWQRAADAEQQVATGWTKTAVNGREAWVAKIAGKTAAPRSFVNCGWKAGDWPATAGQSTARWKLPR